MGVAKPATKAQGEPGGLSAGIRTETVHPSPKRITSPQNPSFHSVDIFQLQAESTCLPTLTFTFHPSHFVLQMF